MLLGLGTGELLFEATGRDVVLEVLLPRPLGDHIRLGSSRSAAEAGAISAATLKALTKRQDAAREGSQGAACRDGWWASTAGDVDLTSRPCLHAAKPHMPRSHSICSALELASLFLQASKQTRAEMSVKLHVMAFRWACCRFLMPL